MSLEDQKLPPVTTILKADNWMRHRDVPFDIWRANRAVECIVHTHDFNEIVVILKGAITHILNEKLIRATAGDVFSIPTGIPHGYSHPQDCSYISVIFQPDFVTRRFPALSEQDEYQAFMHLEPGRRQTSSLYEFLRISPKDLLELNSLMEQIEYELAHQEPGYQTASEAGFARLLIKICRCFGADGRSDSGTLMSIARAINRIRSQYDSALTLDELAAKSGMSKRSFIRHFTINTGSTPMKFLTKTRMDEARRLLENTRYNVTEIAGRVGYDDPSHFSHIFRAVCGETPLGYRKQFLNGLGPPIVSP